MHICGRSLSPLGWLVILIDLNRKLKTCKLKPLRPYIGLALDISIFYAYYFISILTKFYHSRLLCVAWILWRWTNSGPAGNSVSLFVKKHPFWKTRMIQKNQMISIVDLKEYYEICLIFTLEQIIVLNKYCT